MGKTIQHCTDLLFTGMCPDGTGNNKVEGLTKDREIEIMVQMKSRVLFFDLFRFHQNGDTCMQHFGIWFNAEVTISLQEVDQPVPAPQAPAANIQNF